MNTRQGYSTADLHEQLDLTILQRTCDQLLRLVRHVTTCVTRSQMCEENNVSFIVVQNFPDAELCILLRYGTDSHIFVNLLRKAVTGRQGISLWGSIGLWCFYGQSVNRYKCCICENAQIPSKLVKKTGIIFHFIVTYLSELIKYD